MTDATSAPRERDRSLDVAKGLAITAIVLSHVLRGLSAAELTPRESPVFLEVDDGLYVWHLAVFTVLAGAFLRPSVAKRGVGPYLRERLPLFVWLYVLWTVLQWAFRLLSGGRANSSADLDTLGRAFLVADGQLWWLGFLVVMTALAAVVQPWVSRPRAIASTAVVSAVSLAAWGWTGPYLFQEGVALSIFFWVGALAGPQPFLRLTRGRTAAVVAMAGIALGTALLVVTDPMPPSSWLEAWSASALATGVVTSTALCLGIIALSGPLARSPLGPGLAFVGQRSLQIFLAHIIATSGMRVLLRSLGVEDLRVHIVLGLVAGVAFPLLVGLLSRRPGFGWLFSVPARASPPRR
ncbi:fucose 4-O-acetylase-like acetyltransferase [Knoellia remsis]|uniref:Fucose 4-O-acetylase-like acetyltransferase n=1 Tax=Knoellia remsis TaxID=407159 RepID=A0A2T0UTW3_9MICO|nr:acyltransferase [Knoellia remsis]PRY61365.1 fucose 4-O-acetylase-like acetyltransferase [Knoellia remsis]